MDFYRTHLRPLLIHGPMSAQENKNIESDDADGDHGPAATLHAFMAERYQHLRVPFKNSTGILAGDSSLPSLRGLDGRLQCISVALRESVTAYDLDTREIE